MQGRPVRISEHLAVRLKARRIPEDVPLEVFRGPGRRYLDRATGYRIAVRNLPVGGKERVIMLVYEEHPKETLMITACPISERQEANRVRSGRWVKP